MQSPGIWPVFEVFGYRGSGAGYARYSGAARNIGRLGHELWLLQSAGSPTLASFIPIPICASTQHIRGKSRMQQSCPCGSVRGASGNWRPYRDREIRIVLAFGRGNLSALCVETSPHGFLLIKESAAGGSVLF